MNNSSIRHKALPMAWVTTGKHLLLVGGGRIGMNRLSTALQFDWDSVTVVTLDPGKDLARLAETDARVTLHGRPVRESDLDGIDMVIESTDDEALGRKMASWCRKRKIPLNSMDKLDACDIYYPALVFRGPLIVAINSSGDAPALSATLRKQMEEWMGPGWETAAELLAELRNSLPRSDARMDLLKGIAENRRFIEMIENNDVEGMKEFIDDAVSRIPT